MKVRTVQKEMLKDVSFHITLLPHSHLAIISTSFLLTPPPRAICVTVSVLTFQYCFLHQGADMCIFSFPSLTQGSKYAVILLCT